MKKDDAHREEADLSAEGQGERHSRGQRAKRGRKASSTGGQTTLNGDQPASPSSDGDPAPTGAEIGQMRGAPVHQDGEPELSDEQGSGGLSPAQPKKPGEPPHVDTQEATEDTILLDVNPMVRYPLLLFNLFLWLVGAMLICVSSFLYVTAVNTADDSAILMRLDLVGVLIRRLETVVFLAGMSLFIVSFCGCVGALRENSFLLKLYSLALTVLIIINMLLGLVVLFMPGSVKKVIKESLSESLVIHYRDTEDTENVVDALQRQLRCCGMTSKSFRDWNNNMLVPRAI
ncbi:tetraspanin-33 [Rhipicephalus sanguineus]|uniref:tetraspanin-33 n=1 Tax=Rhipicephalus sanguineus TaxID=34632 RepID=UPI0020C1BBAD|nr:tetraspanin-33 [Rhipicephalus sanguineus]